MMKALVETVQNHRHCHCMQHCVSGQVTEMRCWREKTLVRIVSIFFPMQKKSYLNRVKAANPRAHLYASLPQAAIHPFPWKPHRYQVCWLQKKSVRFIFIHSCLTGPYNYFSFQCLFNTLDNLYLECLLRSYVSLVQWWSPFVKYYVLCNSVKDCFK